MWHIYVN